MEENEASDENIENDPDATEEFVRDLIREALTKTTVPKHRRKKPNKVELHAALKGTLSEFLTCYKIMGFDLDGNTVTITAVHNKLEKSAIDSQFMTEFGRFMGNRDQIE